MNNKDYWTGIATTSSGKINVNNNSAHYEENVHVKSTTVDQVVRPSQGNTAILSVNVDKIVKQPLNITPTKNSQSYDAEDLNIDGFSSVSVAGDSDLVAQNIVNGAAIFDTVGSYSYGSQIKTINFNSSSTVYIYTEDGGTFTVQNIVYNNDNQITEFDVVNGGVTKHITCDYNGTNLTRVGNIYIQNEDEFFE